MDLFVLVVCVGNVLDVCSLCCLVLLWLCGSFGDMVFLLLCLCFDVVCVDCVDGFFLICVFIGDIGGWVVLGVGQGVLVIFVFLLEEECEEVICYNVLCLCEFGVYDEVYLCMEIECVCEIGYVVCQVGLFDGMVGLGVLFFDVGGNIVGVLSVGMFILCLIEECLLIVVQMLQWEVVVLLCWINFFDLVLCWFMYQVNFVEL